MRRPAAVGCAHRLPRFRLGARRAFLPSGIANVHCMPSGAHSNMALPLSWFSMLARITFRPKLRADGGATRGPPRFDPLQDQRVGPQSARSR